MKEISNELDSIRMQTFALWRAVSRELEDKPESKNIYTCKRHMG